jgi:hypothetical protein
MLGTLFGTIGLLMMYSMLLFLKWLVQLGGCELLPGLLSLVWLKKLDMSARYGQGIGSE